MGRATDLGMKHRFQLKVQGMFAALGMGAVLAAACGGEDASSSSSDAIQAGQQVSACYSGSPAVVSLSGTGFPANAPLYILAGTNVWFQADATTDAGGAFSYVYPPVADFQGATIWVGVEVPGSQPGAPNASLLIPAGQTCATAGTLKATASLHGTVSIQASELPLVGLDPHYSHYWVRDPSTNSTLAEGWSLSPDASGNISLSVPVTVVCGTPLEVGISYITQLVWVGNPAPGVTESRAFWEQRQITLVPPHCITPPPGCSGIRCF
jgi:hypothetical protein